MTLTESTIPGLTLLHRGKVRETYAVGDDQLLLVATDRLSAFDVVFDQPIPDKGRLLTALSAYWFGRLEALGPTHFLSTAATALPEVARSPELAGRVTLARRARRIDFETEEEIGGQQHVTKRGRDRGVETVFPSRGGVGG